MSVRLSNPMSAVVWLTFLFPAGLIGGRLDFALALAIFAVACVTLWVKPSPWEARAPARQAAWIFAGLQFFYVISYLYSLAFKGAQTGTQDFLDLPRWLLLGGFVVYLIRHHDASVRATTEAAMTAALYFSYFVHETAGERTFAAVLTLCYLLLFSRSKLRLLHAATALVVLFFSAAHPSWAAAPDALRAIRLSPIFGLGPARYEILSSGNSQFMLWLARDGALGVGLMVAGFALAGYRFLRGEEDLRRRAAVAGFLACGALLLLSGPYMDTYRQCYVAAFLLVAVHGPTGSET